MSFAYILYDRKGVIKAQGECPDKADAQAMAKDMNLRMIEAPGGKIDPECHKVRRGRIKRVKLAANVQNQRAWDALRQERNVRLAACDYTQLPDFPGDVDAWKTYRLALRELPKNTTDPHNVNWPVEPS